MSGIKLVYFDIHGRGEKLRLLLAAANAQYEDVRVAFKDWPALKPKTPYQSLPYLEYKGKTYGQTDAIGRFIAREFGLYGTNNDEMTRMDAVIGLWEDQLTAGLVKAKFGNSDEEKAAGLKRALNEDRERFFTYYENFIKKNGSSGYVVGSKLSIADIYIYNMTDFLLKLKADALKEYPSLQKLRTLVESNPNIKKYLATRKPDQ